MPKQKGLGMLETAVMEYLWRNGPATGPQVREAVAAPRGLADSTIRTVLRRLMEKGYVKRESGDGDFRYASAREPRRVAAETVRGVLKSFCRGSLEELLAGLVDYRVVDSVELQRVAAYIAAQKKGK